MSTSWCFKRAGQLCFALLAFSCSEREAKPKEFNAESWRSGDHQVRGEMVQNLVDKKILIGMPRTEVRRLLGAPDTESTTGMTYFFSPEDKISPPPYVNIDFDPKTDLVRDVGITD